MYQTTPAAFCAVTRQRFSVSSPNLWRTRNGSLPMRPSWRCVPPSGSVKLPLRWGQFLVGGNGGTNPRGLKHKCLENLVKKMLQICFWSEILKYILSKGLVFSLTMLVYQRVFVGPRKESCNSSVVLFEYFWGGRGGTVLEDLVAFFLSIPPKTDMKLENNCSQKVSPLPGLHSWVPFYFSGCEI